MGFSEAQEELVLRSWKAMKPDSESIALKFFLRYPSFAFFSVFSHSPTSTYSRVIRFFRPTNLGVTSF